MPRLRLVIVLAAGACASPHPAAEGVARTPVPIGAPPPPGAAARTGSDAAPGEDAGQAGVGSAGASGASAVGPKVADVASCTDDPLAPGFDDDGTGARAALPGRSFDVCSPIDLDGKPPCEVACTLVSPAPDFRSGEDGGQPNFHMLEHTVYFAATRRPANEIGRIVTYDGPLDAANPASKTTVAFVDHLTSPPTLELRSGSCLFDCAGPSLGTLRGDPEAKREAACRAACPPSARYRYDGKRLRRVR